MNVNVDLARLNHILIPPTKEGRDRYRNSRLGRALRPLGRLYLTTTPDGRLVFMLAILAGVLGLDVRRTEAHFLAGLLLSVLLASFLVSARFRMPGTRVEVAAPRRVALGGEAVFTVACSNRGDAPVRAVRVRGPFLPYDGVWLGEPPLLDEIGPQQTAQVALRARFARRGEHHLDPFGAGALVPLGLATGPVVESAGVRFLVVPRVAPVAHLSLPLGRRHHPGGVALASRTGDSSELYGVRPYRPGDSTRDLHARTWARAGVPVVRERQQEYFSRVGVVVDAEAGAAPARAFEAALSLAAGVVAHLAQGEALIDLLVVGEQPHDLTMGRSLGYLEQALDLLACMRPGPPLAPEALLSRLIPHLPRLSCLVLVVLAWDEARRQIVERAGAAGVGCRVLQVGQSAGGEVTAVSIEAIERGEALHL